MLRSLSLSTLLFLSSVTLAQANPIELHGFSGFDGPPTIEISETNPRDDLQLSNLPNSSYKIFVDIELYDAAHHVKTPFGYLITPTLETKLSNCLTENELSDFSGL